MDLNLLHGVALDGLYLLLLLSAPILVAAFVTSVIAGLLSQYSKLSEPAIGHVARLLAVLGGLLIVAPWIGDRLVSFARTTWLLLQVMVS